MQDYTVASGIIVDRGRVVFVQNRRKNGSLDWSTPGGVVDPGESVLAALAREVVEETALHVETWSPLLYTVDVDFIGRDLTLHAEVYGTAEFVGTLAIDDPDDVVVDGRWVGHEEADALLERSPAWVANPLRHALASMLAGSDATGPTQATPGLVVPATPAQWRYDVTGGPGGITAHVLEGPSG